MATVKIRNVSPLGDIWVLGRTVKAGETFEVDESFAGRPPSDFELVDLDAKNQPEPHLTRQVIDPDTGLQKLDEHGRGLIEAYDPGEGLLAQPYNFEPVKHRSEKASEKA